MYKKFVKRLLDIFLSGLALIVLSPILGITAILIRVKLGSPVIFRQKRPGKNGKIFTLYKFRSMSDARDESGELLPDTVRLTKFGRILRSTSLDELPELVNIFRGDMSVIGPRPLAVQYLPFYNETENRRHEMLPGLTGYAQVCGRNSVSWEERFSHDVYYVDHASFPLDVKIIFMTVKSVLCRDGIGERGVDSPVDFDEYRRKQLVERTVNK